MRAHVRYGLAEVSGQIGALQAVDWRERTRRRGARASLRSVRPTLR
jgi:hypothetical protein